ncbi:hypothetical protein ACFYZ9_38430 [Streptomyces sp. NPDC001691]|uniref:hypothetical protein n=1 Tax=Streptomyces sp. NPDC001691 TaxID=3364600 RepID=UPI0036B07BDD
MHTTSAGRLLNGPSQALREVLPREFVGREAELAYLEHFVKPTTKAPSYLWWQAGPWAGKTALLAWFAARRIPVGVDVAHYIVADRLGTNHREDFARTIADQLAAAAGSRRRPAIDPKQPDLYPLYQAAAGESAGRKRRLVLIVDGLDEDADVGPESTGIAGLLPKDPPCGMRVIVAGRPHPGVPRRLGADHPLRDAAIVRLLTDSPAARIIRDAALTELSSLLADRDLGRRLLGLLVAARGALTGADLADLTGAMPIDVWDKLCGVTGRSLAPTRTDLLRLDVRSEREAEAGQQTFVLAHQELHATARKALGRRFRDACTDELCNWAREYQHEGWPHDTPNYLLTGYTRLLHENRDTERLTELALDAKRQLRLIERTGADVALRHLELAAPPDGAERLPLGTAAAIAAARDMLLPHARPLPITVAQAIAQLGDAPRARALAGTSGQAVDKTQNLARVARVLHARGDEQAAATAQAAARWARKALREAGTFGHAADEAEAAAGQAALALLETAQQKNHENSHAADNGKERRKRLEAGLALLRSTRATGTARSEVWAEAVLLLTEDHREQAEDLLNALEEQAEDLACEDPADAHAAAGAIQLWQTVASAAPERADRLVDRVLEHAQEVWNEAPALEKISTLAAAATLAAQSRPAQAQSLVNVACRHLEQVLSPDAPPMTAPDAFHVEFGFRHTVALLKQALTSVGTPPGQITHVLELASGILPSALEEPEDELSRDDEASAEAAGLADKAFRLASHGAVHEAEHHLEQALALLPTAIPGNGHSPVWLPDLAGALVRTDPAADTRPLLELVQHPGERSRVHAALALAYADTQQIAGARRHAQEATRAATRAGMSDRNWPHAAQALASAGDVQTAISLLQQHQQPDSAAARASWRSAHRAARIAVATELTTRDPQAAAELLHPLLERLEASCRAPRSHGLLASMAELMPAAAHLPLESQQLFATALEHARAQVSRTSPHSWRPEDVLVHAFLRINAGEDPGTQLNWLTHDFASRGPEHFPTPALAVLHAHLGESDTALQVAKQPGNPVTEAAALTALASHSTRIPVRPHPLPDPTGRVHFTRAIQYLALDTPPMQPEREASTEAVWHLLSTPGWHQALQVLHKLASEAITKIYDITTTHLSAP